MDERDQVIEAGRAFQAANVQLRQGLRHTEVRNARILRALERGDQLVATMERENLRRLRADLDDDLERLERTKHALRVAGFRLARKEGFTTTELARTWGVSRQLAARYVNEAATAPMKDSDGGAELLEADG